MSEQQRFEQRVRAVLAEITLDDRCASGPADQSIESLGVDSIGMIDLVYALEEQFGITVEDQEVMPENFGSIAAIAALVERKCR